MKKELFFTFFLVFQGFLFSQQVISEAQLQAIEKDVWIPFMEAYATLNPDKLIQIHTKDIVRITVDANTVESGESYLENFGGFLEQTAQQGGGLGIAFALLSTAINAEGTIAFQTGYYEFSSKSSQEAALKVRGYGQFSVGLRLQDGQWRIFLDADKRVPITFEEFESQARVYRL